MTSIQIDIKDGLSSSTAIKGPCRVATTANIALTGEQTIDGVAVVTDDRVLVKDQTTASENGIYVADTGPWRRSKDFNKTKDVRKGTRVTVTDGSVNGGYEFWVTSTDPIAIGTDAITVSVLVGGPPAFTRDYLDVPPYVATLAALKALDTTKDTVAIYDGSTWHWNTGVYTSRVNSDPLGGMFAESDTIPKTAGAWVRSYQGRAKVSWWLAGASSLTTGLAAALLVGVRLFLDAGSYTTSQVAFPANADLLLDRNAIIAPTAAYAGSLFTATSVDNVKIDGGQWDVNTTTFATTKVISGVTSTRVTIKNVLMTAGGLNGVFLQDCQYSTVDNVEVQAAAGRGIYVVKTSTSSKYNKVIRCKSFAAANGHGIQCEGGSYNTIEDCYAHGSKAFGLNLYLETHSTIVNCRAENTEVEGINITGTFNCSVLNCSVRWGAVAGGFTSVDFGMSMDGETTDCNFNTFSNNKIEGCGKSGIAIAGNSQFNLIVDNTIQDVNNLAEANKAAVLLYGGGAINNQIAGNQCFGDANMHYGVRDESTGRNVFGQNNIVSAATGNYSLNANSVTVIETTGAAKVTTGTTGHVLPFTDGLNFWTVTQVISLAATGEALTLYTNDAGAAGVDRAFFLDSASPAVNDVIGRDVWKGRDSAANIQVYGYLQGIINDPTSGSEDFSFQWVTSQAGSLVAAATLGLGYQLGTPTGGDKGVGTLNAAIGYYVNNVKLADSLGVYLGSGGVINFNSGNYTVTHSAGTLTFSGGASWGGALLPTTDDGAALGSTTKEWSDLFLASGAVVNFAAGNYTITHSTGQLAFSGAVLAIGGIGNGPTGVGVGGTVTQATSKTTTVVLNTYSGEITLNAASLAAGAIAGFVFTNSRMKATDLLVLNHVAGGTTGAYSLNGRCVVDGSAAIDVRNNTAGALAEGIVIRFGIYKGVNN